MSVCVHVWVLRDAVGGMSCVMCVWLAGVPTICPASTPVSHHASLSAFLSVCHSFVFPFLHSDCFIYSFAFKVFICETHIDFSHACTHMAVRTHTHIHTLYLQQYSLCLSKGSRHLKIPKHTSVSYFDQIALDLRVTGLFVFAYSL